MKKVALLIMTRQSKCRQFLVMSRSGGQSPSLDRDPSDRDYLPPSGQRLPLGRDPFRSATGGGRYTSYWNAFLLNIVFKEVNNLLAIE